MAKESEEKKVDEKEPHIMGTAVLGERGQLVVPKEVRDCYNLKTGDKFMVMGHGHGPIIFIPVNQMRSFIKRINQQIESAMEETK
ncbi:MAG: AbrB/MazE/SpoVT family DNA-binding domain-containing protein [Patescibacteria group bacterium]|jgi:AbrB family looped-hinge helix DNA binding protein